MSTESSCHCSVERSATAQPTTFTSTSWYGKSSKPATESIHLLYCFSSDSCTSSRCAAVTGTLDSQRTQ